MFILYNILFPVLFLLYFPFYLIHILKRGGLSGAYMQRFGFFSSQLKKQLAEMRNKVWIHAVSVGESVAAVSFIKAWQAKNPRDNIVFSCSTSTAYETMKKKNLPGVTVIYCPIDFWWAVRRALKIISPKILVIFEVEIWPNLILQTAAKDALVALVNGRMSDHSSKGYKKWRFIFRPIFKAFSVICVQTEEDAERFGAVLGSRDTVKVCDTMKFDQVPDMDTADVSSVLDSVFGTAPRLTFVAGSTHPGEETMVVNAFKELKRDFPNLKMVLVPRHAEREHDVTAILDEAGIKWQRLKSNIQPDGTADVLVVNTTGELMNYYSAADAAYVGKSMAGQTGGHNIIEPAIFGKAILHGTHMENFRAVAAVFKQRSAAVEVQKDEDFTGELRKLLADPELRKSLGERARATVESCRGAIARTLRAIDNSR